MQTLLQAVLEQFKEWPESENAFTCDPDGEVRGDRTIGNDFYPDIDVFEDERGDCAGSDSGTIVTKEMFESN